MRVIMSVSMSNDKKTAEQIVTNHLPQVLDNLVKMWMFKTTPSLKKEWTDEIADKHIMVIRKVSNNLSTKKGHLSAKVIEHVWNEIMTVDSIKGYCRSNGRNPKYSKLVKVKEINNSEELYFKLKKYGNVFASKILVDKLEQDDVIAADLAELTQF